MIELEPGTQIGKGKRFTLKRTLGEGASSLIWLAKDEEKDREVALKILHVGSNENPTLRQRFVREGQRFGQLRHPNLVRIRGLGQEGSRLFLVIDYVPGKSVGEVLRDGAALPVEHALVVVRDAAAGLHVAHEAGVVHRDLKPANVMIQDDGVTKVLDFGIAKDLNSNTGLTRMGFYVGTPAYSAPEQIRGDEIDHRTDIYSLGVMLYEMLTGPLDVDGTTTELFTATLREQRIPLGRLHKEISKPVARLVQRMTRNAPGRRPQSMAEVSSECARMVAMLRGDLSGEDTGGVTRVLKTLFQNP